MSRTRIAGVRSLKWLHARKALLPFNRALFRLGAIGMGVGPYDDTQVDERNFLKKHVRQPDPLIFDVGANTGQYASLALSVHPKAKVVSFEPQPSAFAKLSSVAEALKFKAFPFAVGASAGKAQIFSEQSSNLSEFASLIPGVIENIHH